MARRLQSDDWGRDPKTKTCIGRFVYHNRSLAFKNRRPIYILAIKFREPTLDGADCGIQGKWSDK